ncbi:hypothetical protein [Streptomyces sp. NPDC053560]|uniref:hypothetical protein n=1 Tax=Streptomyces sp. NPDC053560 TaxID=3365711 RepID=UPI0037CE35FB
MARASAKTAAVVTVTAVVGALAGGVSGTADGRAPADARGGRGAAAADGLRHTTVEVSPGGCGCTPR